MIYVVIILLGFFGVAIISYNIDYETTLENTANNMYAQAYMLTSSYASQYYAKEYALKNMTMQFEALASYDHTILMLVNADGELIVSTDRTLQSGQHTYLDDFNPAFTGNKRYVIGNFNNYFAEDHLTVIAPVSYNYAIRGYIIIHKSISDIKTELAPIFNTNYLTLIICMALASLFLVVEFFEVHKPINEITKAVKEFGHGNLTYQLKEYNDDEIGRLAAGLNYMSQQLNEIEESQKKFIANVSHDFRSPLTSIKGYLEAILDGTITHDMQDKYLNIVIFETERLSKLTNNLLTLNNMDSTKNRLNLEDFDINQVIRHTVETFEGTCKNKGIKFDITFSEQECFVNADHDKINQVLYNLIDNAIKFSHHDSIIYISVSERGGKTFVSVKDTGIGIPKESLGKIWDRFYKTDLSRGKDKKGTGLGLSIVKEIINAHHENIDVISTEGAGTEFTFSLRRTPSEE
jgi:signal transduction histidine kinase